MNLLEKLHNGLVFFDGGTGSCLQAAGLAPGEAPEIWNRTHPQEIESLHRAYIEAGAEIIKSNTFGINPLRYPNDCAERVTEAMSIAHRAADGRAAVALDVGPLGKMLAPLGDLDFEDAVSAFAAVIRAGAARADLILIETMSDTAEVKAAVLAAKENCDLPVFVTLSFDGTGKLMTGADPLTALSLLEGLRVDAVGLNCSMGPDAMIPLMETLYAHASLPLIANPNAGLPREENGKTVYDLGPADFAAATAKLVAAGARAVGGCCGTTPAHIAALKQAVKDLTPLPVISREETVVSSFSRAVVFGNRPVIIGERLNPTGKKKLKEALRAGDMSTVLQIGIAEEEQGAEILDVNVGLPEVDEPTLLTRVMGELQAVTALPLQLDTSSPVAMERALRRYNGKAMVNSVNGTEESMNAIFPLVAKYGGVLVALTLDESGIPETAAGRLAIARRILDRAAAYGIGKKDIIFDPLALTVSSDITAPGTTLDAISMIKKELGAGTSLGVSNVSFGLPDRETVTSTFFAAALDRGLDAAIMNPGSAIMMRTYHAHLALAGKDPACADYIAAIQRLGASASTATAATATNTAADGAQNLKFAILKGLRTESVALTTALLAEKSLLTIVEEEILPALDECGRRFEAGTLYLPQLLMSAEAAKAAFDTAKATLPEAPATKGRVILATVKGDIHDIGKNIVRVILESYGFSVIDLGRDVAPEAVLRTAKEQGIGCVGLSALMTTTVPAMRETVELLHRELPHVKVCVGGAVLTAEYARSIGADAYCRDAMATVRFAEQFANERV
ncbi:MAG: homocysteine S-methyltransferase family protein [Clostridia bacterium]|nr:homocysteine S-methyltransferase family protein [Clostridia bacterium]